MSRTKHVQDGGYSYPDEDIGAQGDHLVKADVPDTDPGTLLQKLNGGTNITISEATVAGVRTAKIDAPAFYSGAMAADSGSGSPGDPADNTTAKGTHKHPAAPIIPPGAPPGATPEMFLYPSEVPDPLLRASVKCLLAKMGEGLSFGGSAPYWVPIAGVSTYQANVVGTVRGIDSSGNSTIALNAGDRVLAVEQGLISFGGDAAYFGPYVVINSGSSSTKAVIARTSDANTSATLCNGMTVFVNAGSGVEYAEYYFTLTTSDPIVVDTTSLAFTYSTSYTPNVTHPLLTAAQRLTAGADNASTLTTTATGDSGSTSSSPSTFTSLLGTPGVASLPAALYGFQLEGITVTGGDVGATTTMQAQLVDVDGGDGTILAATSPPLPAAGSPAATVAFQAALATAYAFSPTKRLGVVYVLATTSTTPVTVTFAYSSPNRKTWIQLPVQLASPGATLTGELTPQFWDTYVAIETSPTVKDERVCDFDRLKTATTPVEFTAYAKADSGQTGTLKVLIGGTKGTADGTTIAETTVIGSGVYAVIKVAGTFANPGSLQAVKLALESSDAAHPFFIESGYLTLGSTTS